MDALGQIDSWSASFAAAGVTHAGGVVATRGDTSHAVRLASVSKPITALATLIAVEEGVVDLDAHAGPPGSTLRHLLAHASGLPFEGHAPVAPPGRRRIYSNEGFAQVGAHVAQAAGMPFADYIREAVCAPLGLRLDPEGHPGAGMHADLDDVLETLAEMTSVQFPGLDGVFPDYGRYAPLDWGLGVELRDAKEPHWTGTRLSPPAFGHFGGSGTFLWVDPVLGIATVVLTTRPFGPWAKEAWPALSDAIVAELGAT
jgi:CubicO group peptidase (beta-lactamase class C family)